MVKKKKGWILSNKLWESTSKKFSQDIRGEIKETTRPKRNESENSQRTLEKEKYILKWKEDTEALELTQGLQILMATQPVWEH